MNNNYQYLVHSGVIESKALVVEYRLKCFDGSTVFVACHIWHANIILLQIGCPRGGKSRDRFVNTTNTELFRRAFTSMIAIISIITRSTFAIRKFLFAHLILSQMKCCRSDHFITTYLTACIRYFWHRNREVTQVTLGLLVELFYV